MDETLGRTTAATGATGAGAPRHRAMAGIGRVAIAATAALLLVGCSSGGDVAVPDVEPGGAAMSDDMRADDAPGDGAPAPTRGNGAGQGTGPDGAQGGPNPTRGNGEPQPGPGAGDSGPLFPAPPRPAPPGPEIPASELNLAGIRDCEQGAHTWRIISGDVSCAEATDVGLRYQEALREGVGTGAGEHVYVDDWTCTTPSDARARELGAVAECTRPDGSRVHELKK